MSQRPRRRQAADSTRFKEKEIGERGGYLKMPELFASSSNNLQSS